MGVLDVRRAHDVPDGKRDVTVRTNKVNRAVGALMYHGVSVSQLAQEAGVTPSAITHQLSGNRSMPRYTIDAMHRLIGQDATAFVLEAVPDSRRLA